MITHYSGKERMDNLRQHIEYYRLELMELIGEEGNFLEPEVLAKSKQLDEALNKFMRMKLSGRSGQ
jgi:hypothetical protein